MFIPSKCHAKAIWRLQLLELYVGDMMIMMKLCPLVEDDRKSLAIKGDRIPEAQNFFSQRWFIVG